MLFIIILVGFVVISIINIMTIIMKTLLFLYFADGFFFLCSFLLPFPWSVFVQPSYTQFQEKCQYSVECRKLAKKAITLTWELPPNIYVARKQETHFYFYFLSFFIK